MICWRRLEVCEHCGCCSKDESIRNPARIKVLNEKIAKITEELNQCREEYHDNIDNPDKARNVIERMTILGQLLDLYNTDMERYVKE